MVFLFIMELFADLGQAETGFVSWGSGQAVSVAIPVHVIRGQMLKLQILNPKP